MLNKTSLYVILLVEFLLFYLFRSNSDGEMVGNLFAGLVLCLILFDVFLIAMTLSSFVYSKLRGVIEILMFVNVVAFFVFVVAPLSFMLLVSLLPPTKR